MSDKLFDLEMTAAGEWSASGKPRFNNPDGSQFGGYVSGLLLAAILQEPGKRGTPVAMTGVFMTRVAIAPLKVRTAKLRAGNSLEFWQAEIVQEQKLCAQATITLAQRPQGGPSFGWIEMPKLANPESLPSTEYIAGTPGWTQSFDRRIAKGRPLEKSDGHSLIWATEFDDHPVDYPRLAMFADMFPPRTYYGTGERRGSATVSFSTYFHASDEEVAKVGHDYILLEGRGRRGSHGVCDLTAAIWRRDGLLLATTEQLCWFR
jgi:acyl-CoA thioesterase